MSVNSVVEFESLQRSSDGNVIGSVFLKIYGKLAGIEFEKRLEERTFSFPSGGSQEVYKTKFTYRSLEFEVHARVHEESQGQCCVQGHLHIKPIVGGGVGVELAPNCHPIPDMATG
ncbi:hypothetical protein [Aureimonas sp. AU40]|uniref:hypothetical protein n=1 Tax=Aureimonas sp. AU40 TaxID=1637747 RepID=UPI0012E34161|nr:hypothetical protein [Aureimonas sp. AU40]